MEPDIKKELKNEDQRNAGNQDHMNEASVRRRNGGEKKRQKLGPSSERSEKAAIESKLRKRRRKDDTWVCSRFLAFLMISPSVVYIFSVLYDIISKYSVSGQFFHIGALILGFLVAAAICTFLYKPLKPYFKYLALASLCVLFLPTMQVFNCSPIPIDNSKLGTMLRLNEDIDQFLKTVYQNSSCWRNQYFRSPFEFSAYSPRLRIFVKPYQVINLGMQHFDEKDDTHDGPPPEILPFTLYLLTSPRSVKRQMFSINLLVMVAGKARGIADVLELGVDDRENVTLYLTGSLKRMGAEFNNTRLELEQMQYLFRPLVFHVHETEVFGMPEKDEESENREKRKKKNNSHKNGHGSRGSGGDDDDDDSQYYD